MAQFSAQEQYFLELVNRARMNPAGEAARYGISLNQGLAPDTISATSKQVLAPNSLLHDAARDHSAHMFAVDLFAHHSIGDGTMSQRISATGYAWTTIGENIAWSSENSISRHHENLFRSAGHRENILNNTFQEVGIGSLTGSFVYDGSTWNGSLMTTHNFATMGSGTFVTGVNYIDNVIADDFYTVGEGIAGRTIRIFQDGVVKKTTNGQEAGGYAFHTNLSGSMEIVFSGTDLSNEKGASFTLGATNVKIDMVDPSTIDANVSITLTRGATDAHLLGIGNITAKGNSAANKLYGNAAKNKLIGMDGADRLYGSAGADELNGGRGADYLSGGSGADRYRYNAMDEGGDSISMFSADDFFVFDGSAFGLADAVGTLAASRFRLGASPLDSTDRFIFNPTDDTLWFDSNGSLAGGTQFMIADIANNAVVTAADILII